MTQQNTHLDSLRDIQNMMKRSTRFISLSGLSGIAAGIFALAGAVIAYEWIEDSGIDYTVMPGQDSRLLNLKLKLILLAAAVMLCAFFSAMYFTWRRAGKKFSRLWNHAARQLIVNTAIPIIAGGAFIISMIQQHQWQYAAPASLIFYGLALVSGSRYTVSEIRYLGYLEILLGLLACQYLGKGLYFWAAGFGVLHIIYGGLMWWRYERNGATETLED